MSRIHPTAIVESGAEIDPTVEIGAYTVVGPNVRLGSDVVLRAHAHVTGHTEIGAGSVVYPFAVIGEAPQDRKYRGEPTRLVIGERAELREHVTVNPGTADGGGLTRIGDDCLLQISCHVGHDSQIGDDVNISNAVALGGHVIVEDHAVIGAMSGVHQFVRIGDSAMLAAMSGLSQDVAPYTIAHGNHASVVRVNKVNLERQGFSEERIRDVERAFRMIFRSGKPPRDAFADVREQLPHSAEAEHMVAFLEKSERGFCRVR